MPPGACEGFRPAQVGEVVDRPTPTAFAQLMKTIAAERPMAEALRGPERGYVATREVVAVIVSKTLDDGQWVLHLRDQEDHRTIPNV